VTAASSFYKDSGRTIPYPNPYTTSATLSVQLTLPITYGGSDQGSTCAWLTKNANLATATFNPPDSSSTSFRWTPTVVGPTTTVIRIHNVDSTSDGYEQTFTINVLPEPSTLCLALGACALAAMRRAR
jgi:hypothetical protein